VRFKALTAGAGNLALATAAGHTLPALRVAVFSLAVGSVSYGLSIVLDVYAPRYIGAARESAYFATAPFVGAVAAIPLLGERMRTTDRRWIGMAVGVTLLMAGRSNELHEARPVEFR
jgi:drug/metabolite transporter (DMT)-like permease